MAVSVTQILRQWEWLKGTRNLHEALRDEIAEVIDPWRGVSSQTLPSPGAKRTEKLFDSTALVAKTLLASTLHGTLTPSTQPWLSLSLRQREWNEDAEVRGWLEDCGQRMHLALRQSNFSSAVHQMYQDLVGPAATGCLFVDEGAPPTAGTFGGFRCRTYMPSRYCLAENYDGAVDTVFVDQAQTARALVGRWGDRVGTRVVETAASKPYETFTVLHATQPRADRAYRSDGTARGGARNLPWATCFVIVETKTLVEEGGYHEFPFMVPRWMTASGEIYGTGPSHQAAPDVRTLNAAKEFLLKAAPLAMFPPTLERDNAVLQGPDLTPGGRNVVSGSGPLGELFAFLQTGLKIDLSQIVLSDLRQAILETYYIPQLRLKESPQMTATEVQARLEEMYRYLGPTLARLEAEFLNPFVERVFGLMARAGALAPMPEALRQLGEAADLDVEYEGPLARAQRTIELTAQERVLTFASAITTATAPVRPDLAAEVWDTLDLDQMLRDRADVAGLPSDQMRAQAQVQALRAERAEAQAAQQERDATSQMAEAGGKAAPLIQALEQATSGQNGQPAAARTP